MRMSGILAGERGASVIVFPVGWTAVDWPIDVRLGLAPTLGGLLLDFFFVFLTTDA